jgi:DNA-binding MarR family transcriptional regulator
MATPRREPTPAARLALGMGFRRSMRETSRLLDRELGNHVARHGLTLSQYFLLRELWDEDGATVRELAERLRISEPSTTAMLDTLVGRGLIVRTPSSEDRRKTHIYLTPKARALRAAVARDVAVATARCYRGTTVDEIAAAVRLFEKLGDNLR